QRIAFVRMQGPRGEGPDRPQLADVRNGNLIERTETGEPIVAPGKLPLTGRRTSRWESHGGALRRQRIRPERRDDRESEVRSLHWGHINRSLATARRPARILPLET